MVLRRPHSAQALVDRLGHRHDAFLVALADDPQQAAGLVDGGDGESGGLADAEAAGIHQAEAAAVDRVADAAQNASHLGMGKRLRQALLPGVSTPERNYIGGRSKNTSQAEMEGWPRSAQ